MPRLKKSRTVAEDGLVVSKRPKGCIRICVATNFEIDYYLQTLDKHGFIREKHRERERERERARERGREKRLNKEQ